MSEDYKKQYEDKSLAKKVQKKASKNTRRENKMQLDNFKYSKNEDDMFNLIDEMED